MATPEATCPQCHGPTQPGDRFCGRCGAGLKSGRIDCPHCGKSVPADSQFCGYCSRPLQAAAPSVWRGRWNRSPEEVAVRFEAANLAHLVQGLTEPANRAPDGERSLLRRGGDAAAKTIRALVKEDIVIEEGTAALLLQHGQPEILEPGHYGGGTLGERLRDVVAGDPFVVVLMDISSVELPCAVQDLLTAESVQVAADGRVVVRVSDAVTFNNVVLKGERRLTRTDLAGRLAPEFRLALLDALGGKPLDELRSGAALQEQLRQSVDGDLRRALTPWGLELVEVRGLTLSGEVMKEFQGQRGELFQRGARLDLERLSAELDRREFRQRAADALELARLHHERDRLELKDEVSYERELEKLRQEREQLTREDALGHARRIAEIDRQLADLEARERVADHRREKATQVEMAGVDLESDAQQAGLEVSQAEKLTDLYRRAETVKLDRLRTDEDVDKVLSELNANKALRDDELETLHRGLLERREDRELARDYLLQRVKLEMDLQQQRIRLEGAQQLNSTEIEHELAARRKHFEADQAEERARHEQKLASKRDRTRLTEEEDQADLRTMERMMKLKQGDTEHAVRMEAERLAARSGATVAALLSLMREQGDTAGAAEVDQTLRELARTEQYKGLDVDAILAMQAGDSPEVAKIFQARAKAEGYEDVVEARMEAAKDALEQERRHSRETRELYEKHAGATSESAARAMKHVSDIAQSVAGSARGETVIVSPTPGVYGQGPTVIGRQAGSPVEPGVSCPSCRAPQKGTARFCDQCGAPLRAAADGAACPNCQGVVPRDNRFCPHCGTAVG